MAELSNHGDFDIKVSGNVIFATLSGSWNGQTAEELGPFQRNSFEHQYEVKAWLAAAGFHLDTAYQKAH